MIGTTAYLACDDRGLQIVDASDPVNPAPIGQIGTPGRAWDVPALGTIVYVADQSGGVQIVDASNATAPTIIGSIDTGYAGRMTVEGDLVFVSASYGGVIILDAADPPHPVILGSADGFGKVVDVVLIRTTAYAAVHYKGIQRLDVSDPSAPTSLGLLPSISNAITLRTKGTTLYTSDWSGGFRMYDLADPADPELVGWYNTPRYITDLEIDGDLVYASSDAYGLYVFGVSTPATPPRLGSIGIDAVAVAAADHTAYVAMIRDDRSVLDIIDASDPASLLPLGSLDLPVQARDIDVEGSVAYLALGRTGLLLVDVADAHAPVILGSYDAVDAVSVAVQSQIAYVADSEDRGMLIIDCASPTSPVLIGTTGYLGGRNYDVGVQGGLAVLADNDEGIYCFDVTDPAHPRFVSLLTPVFGLPDYRRVAVFDDFVCAVGFSFKSLLAVFDVSDPAAPVLAASIEPVGKPIDVTMQGRLAFVAGAGVEVFDLLDPYAPRWRAYLQTSYSARVAADTGRAYIADVNEGLVVAELADCPPLPGRPRRRRRHRHGRPRPVRRRLPRCQPRGRPRRERHHQLRRPRHLPRRLPHRVPPTSARTHATRQGPAPTDAGP